MVYEFKLPDIGEGVAEGEVLKWMVKEGDRVKEDEPLVEVMTDKVNVQIPAPRTGVVSKILVKEGDIAKVGQTIMIIDDGSATQVSSTQAPCDTPTTSSDSSHAGPLCLGAFRFTSRVAGILQDTKRLLSEVM